MIKNSDIYLNFLRGSVCAWDWYSVFLGWFLSYLLREFFYVFGLLLQIISPYNLYLNPKLVVQQWEIWRLITNFLYFRRMGNNRALLFFRSCCLGKPLQTLNLVLQNLNLVLWFNFLLFLNFFALRQEILVKSVDIEWNWYFQMFMLWWWLFGSFCCIQKVYHYKAGFANDMLYYETIWCQFVT